MRIFASAVFRGADSSIAGVNTLFLLDGGLRNMQGFVSGIPHVTYQGNLGGFPCEIALIPRMIPGNVVLANADFFGSALVTEV